MRTMRAMRATEFSDTYPAGTEMLYHPVRGDMHAEWVTVRSEAWALGHGAVVVKVTGHSGGVLTEHLQPMPSRPATEEDREGDDG